MVLLNVFFLVSVAFGAGVCTFFIFDTIKHGACSTYKVSDYSFCAHDAVNREHGCVFVLDGNLVV